MKINGSSPSSVSAAFVRHLDSTLSASASQPRHPEGEPREREGSGGRKLPPSKILQVARAPRPTPVPVMPTLVDVTPTLVDGTPTLVDVTPTLVDVTPTLDDVMPTLDDVMPTRADVSCPAHRHPDGSLGEPEGSGRAAASFLQVLPARAARPQDDGTGRLAVS